jgi:NADH dehydrogenase [ubiquinone] 1 alpha subcomplex assembly factor 7
MRQSGNPRSGSWSREPLKATFRRLIEHSGPISMLQFMGESNARYYDGRNPIGRRGDFVTAPEISQMFGEMVGLWLADIWQRAGRPEPVHYVELGPGRGTLARDALRACAGGGLRPSIHLVEASTELREIQRRALPAATWHDDVTSLPEDGPLLIVANEFLDALPVRQIVLTPDGWRERMVGLEGEPGVERLVPVAGSRPMDALVPGERRALAPGTIIETCPGASAVIGEIARRLVVQGGAAVFIDYGYDRPQLGSTLQAVRAHRRCDPFEEPGEADLTALVDFPTLKEAAEARGVQVFGPTTQGDWLRTLGIEVRAGQLAHAVPRQAQAVQTAMARLIDDDQMGSLFKVMALAAPDWPDGAGFVQGADRRK